MLRILGVQRNAIPEREFVLLQNQGGLKVSLRGHLVLAERGHEQGDMNEVCHLFTDNEAIPAGMYVLLVTGRGETRWARTKDGAMVFHAFMNRPQPIWQHVPDPIHLLVTQHTYADRGPALMLR